MRPVLYKQLRILGLQGSQNIALLTSAVSKMSEKEAAHILVQSKLTREQQLSVLTMKTQNKKLSEQVLSTAELELAQKKTTTSTQQFSNAMASFGAALKAYAPYLVISVLSTLSSKFSETEGKVANSSKLIAGSILLIGTTSVLAFKLAGGAAMAFMSSNPLGWLLAALSAIVVSVKAVVESIKGFANASTEAKNKAIDAAKASKDAWEETKSELKEINNELETVYDRLEELQTLADNGTITLTEQAELDKLQSAVTLLESEKAALESIEKMRHEKTQKDAADAINKSLHEKFSHRDLYTGDVSAATWSAAIESLISLGLYDIDPANPLGLKKWLAKDIPITELLDQKLDGRPLNDKESAILDDLFKTLTDHSGDLTYYSGDNLAQWQKDVNEAYNTYWEIIHKFNIANGEFDTVLNSVFEMDRFAGVKDVLTELANTGEVDASVLYSLYKTNDAFKDMIDYLSNLGLFAWESASSIIGLTNQVREMNEETASEERQTERRSESLSKYQERINAFKLALDEYNATGEVSSDTYSKVIALGEDYAKIFDFTDGKIKLVKEDLTDLVQELMNETGATLAANGATKEQIALLAILANTLGLVFSSTEDGESAFEKAYKEHQHYLEMDKESLSDYLSWLKGAYKAAYDAGEIELDDYYKYQEEVYEKTRELFEDYVNDDEHQIDLLSHHKGNESEIIASYQRLQEALHAEANKYRAMGLDENSEHIQELQNQWWDYEEKIANVFKTGFDDIQKSYSDRIDQIEHLQTTANNALESMETLGLIESGNYYDQLITNETEKISLLEEQYTELVAKLTEGIATGVIAKGSEDFNDMSSSISSVAEELQSAKIALDGYSNSLRQLDWDRFDYLQDEISKITDESDYLVDLMSNRNLTDENGNLNEYGDATVGLHGLNYNVYLHQAQQYADEIARIEKELANDQYNQDLIERKEELLELQREMVLAAEDEKQAIIDLVQEGIDAELESLQELIDKYKDALDSAKDLYDYQNKVADVTDEISKLQKQIIAYENDTSEEAKAQIQQLKVDLEKAQKELQETEYDQFIADQKKLLDNLYTSHEQNLNQRIDDVDTLLEESINAINDNSSDIRSTLEMVSETAGTKLSNHMESIWSTSGGVGDVISTFNSDFDSSMTTVSSTLAAIKEYVSAIKTNSDNFDFGNDEPIDFTVVEVEPNNPQAPEWSGNTEYSTPSVVIVGDEEEVKKLLGNSSLPNLSGHGNNKFSVKQFATGGRVDYTGLAWLDGTKSRPEYVLNPDQTEWLFEAAKAYKDISLANPYGINYEAVRTMLPSYIGHTLSREKVSEIINNTSNNTNTKQDIHYETHIEIDHVENYEDFVTKLQSDSKFEKMIQSMTIGRVNGGNPLDKYQYKWK